MRFALRPGKLTFLHVQLTKADGTFRSRMDRQICGLAQGVFLVHL
jgi:hypothetical protein